MNTIKLNSLTTDVAVYQQNGEFYFDLKQIATNLGYARPDKAAKDFLNRNSDFIENGVSNAIIENLVAEPVMYLFLMQSNAPKAKEFQLHVCREVLPAVRKVGMVAIKKLEAQQLVHTNRQSPELLPELEKMLGDDVEQFCRDNQYYRILGYLPPTEIMPKNWDSAKFWKYIDLEKSDCFYSARWHNAHREDGRWYAFKTTVYHEIPEEEPKKVCEVLYEDEDAPVHPSHQSAWDL